MKKLTTTLSALAIAAALVMNLTACSNDDNVIDTPKQPEVAKPGAVSTVRVTVGAGIGDGMTRAAVTQEGTTRTLTFTANDRIFVREGIYSSSPVKYLAGYLDMVGSPSADGKNATFSGNLGVYLADGTPSSYDFGDADPLTVDVPEAFLVPADAPAGFVSGTMPHIVINDSKMIAADVNTLMTSALYVYGVYDRSTKHFSLSTDKPILNCTIGHLQNNTEYTVKLRYAENQSDYEADNVTEITYDAMTVTSDDNGLARFVISGFSNRLSLKNLYYALQLVPVAGGSTKTYILGQKDLGAKVYNVTTRLYGTCKLTVQMPSVPGTTYYEECSSITVKCGDNVIYELPSNNLLTFLNGQTGITFQMEPVTDATLTIIGTKKTGSGTVTYSGTASGVTILYNQTTSVGPVSLTKQ